MDNIIFKIYDENNKIIKTYEVLKENAIKSEFVKLMINNGSKEIPIYMNKIMSFEIFEKILIFMNMKNVKFNAENINVQNDINNMINNYSNEMMKDNIDVLNINELMDVEKETVFSKELKEYFIDVYKDNEFKLFELYKVSDFLMIKELNIILEYIFVSIMKTIYEDNMKDETFDCALTTLLKIREYFDIINDFDNEEYKDKLDKTVRCIKCII